MRRFFLTSLLVGGLQAAVPAPRLPLRPRQASTTSYITETLGYTSALTTTNGDTVWAPFTIIDYWTSSVDSFFGWCYTTGVSYDYSAYSYISAYSTCNVYTTCDSNGMLSAESTSYQCAGEGWRCVTYELYDSWGATEADTNLGCTYTESNATTAIFRTRPAAHVSVSSTEITTTTGTPTPSTTPASPASTTSAPPATSPPAGGGGGSSNTGVIAGSVVGGVAVLAIAGVAIFWIMRRSRSNQNTPDPNSHISYAPSGGVPSYYQPQPEKPGGDNMTMMHQYDPHSSVVYSHTTGSPTGIGSTSPHPPQSPVPLYPEGFRGEMDGTGVPNIRTPPPPPHTGY